MKPAATLSRRNFLLQSGVVAGAAALAGPARGLPGFRREFPISLAGWSLHRRHFQEKRLPAEDFPKVAREEFDIGAVEYVNTMLPTPTYAALEKINAAAARHEVRNLLIMCDGEGNLSDQDPGTRLLAVRNHHKWVDVAEVLGCHAIRVNTGGAAGAVADIERCGDSLRRLADYASQHGISVIAENHGGLSSHPESLVAVMKAAGSPLVGTLPDFGNFPEETDRYAAVRAMMPYAKAVSAKCYDFDADGRETRIDYERMIEIVWESGYRGHVGIEYEGSRLSESEGILACRNLLRSLGGY